jgi:uncharacterized membrane protein YkvA (DUF1232 family)
MKEPTGEQDPGATPEGDSGKIEGAAGAGPGSEAAGTASSILLFLPRLVALLAKLVVDPEVSGSDKLLLGAAVLYVASPIDLLPDFVPVIGQLDDIYLVALCLLRLMNRSGEAKLRSHWDGPEDIVKVLNTITDYATRYLPSAVRGAVRGWVEARDGAPPA